MAVDASTTAVVLGASSFGPGVVVTSAGVVFAQSAVAPGPTSTAYWYYNGSNLVGNAPTGAGFQFTVNGVQQGLLSTAGFTSAANITTTNGNIQSLASNGFLFYSTSSPALDFRAVAVNPTNIVGQIAVQHIAGGSTANGIGRTLIGLGAGTTSSGTAVTASGHDLAGRIGVTVNSTGTASQPVLLVSFATAYNTPPFVSLTPQNAATATIPLAQAVSVVSTTSGFAVMGNSTGLAAGTYAWVYSAIQ